MVRSHVYDVVMIVYVFRVIFDFVCAPHVAMFVVIGKLETRGDF